MWHSAFRKIDRVRRRSVRCSDPIRFSIRRTREVVAEVEYSCSYESRLMSTAVVDAVKTQILGMKWMEHGKEWASPLAHHQPNQLLYRYFLKVIIIGNEKWCVYVDREKEKWISPAMHTTRSVKPKKHSQKALLFGRNSSQFDEISLKQSGKNSSDMPWDYLTSRRKIKQK